MRVSEEEALKTVGEMDSGSALGDLLDLDGGLDLGKWAEGKESGTCCG